MRGPEFIGVHGVLLFAKAQPSLKLIVYLKLNKNVSREKITWTSPTRLFDCSYTHVQCATTHSKHKLGSSVVTEFTTNEQFLSSSPLMDHQEVALLLVLVALSLTSRPTNSQMWRLAAHI